MMFFPCRVDLDLRRIPWVTLLVCVACIFIFLQQLDSRHRYVNAVNNFCQDSPGHSTQRVLSRFKQTAAPGNCASIFDNLVQLDLTSEYAFNPLQTKVVQMFTSVLSHSNWVHLLFNLVFFYAFAASVELITGSLIYTAIILLMALSTNLAYTLLPGSAALPTVGLSGIVVGMMALLAVALPAMRIRCFVWVLLYFKVLRIPALLLALWYIGWDVYNTQADAGSSINYIVHIGGAFTGAAVGFVYWLTRGDYLQELITDY